MINFSSSGGILGNVYLVRLIKAFVCAVANNSDLKVKPYEFEGNTIGGFNLWDLTRSLYLVMIVISISYLFKIEEVQLDNPKQRSLTYRLFIGFLQLLILRPTCKIRKLFFIVIVLLEFALTFHGPVTTRRCDSCKILICYLIAIKW